ncbi:DUF397 domain-containing protein [Haloechinothrix sp. YIM 98757]|uniref:DUF397 domain-containing protein n=1 Tax=Haloechinothrix aidingensis TaxID=2752311 RepID=A0A838AAU1_9PSEU|nr:DUF397 domain-containing protein [Haloechinothrix aidingensis]MBA0126359.1 DUF397 domain-containing protein [Haloechinothrix aidingensis]
MAGPELTAARWQRSSYSGDAARCVEVAFSPARWSSSSYDTDEDGHCVQVAVAGRSVSLRDSKDPSGASLVLPSRTWNAFLDGLR